MTPTSDPRHEPEEHEPIAEQAPGDAVDFIDKTVAEITDTEVDEHLNRVLSRAFSGRPCPTTQISLGVAGSAFSFDQVNEIILSTFQKQAADAAAERLQIAWDAAMAAREQAEQILADARRQAAETAAQMINDARGEAEQIIADARAEAERIRASATLQAMTDQAEALPAIQRGRRRFINCLPGIQPPAASTGLAVLAAVAAWEPTSVTALVDALAAAPLPASITAVPGALAAAWEPGSVTALVDALAAAPLAAALMPTVLTAVPPALAAPQAAAATQGHCLLIGTCSNASYADEPGPDSEGADSSDTDLGAAEAFATRIKQIVMRFPAGEGAALPSVPEQCS
jgi:vacuolar-type H+-ATPase subunit H